MAPLATNVQRAETRAGARQGLPVKDGAVIYDGALVCIDSAGLAIAATTTAGLIVAGVAVKGFDNTDGTDGALGAAPARYCEVERGKSWSFLCAGSPIAGEVVYVVDDNNVTTVAGNVIAGVLLEPDPENTGRWYVFIPGVSLRAASAALTFTAVAGTANTTLEAIPDPADTPADADALREDIVTNVLPAIRNNFADLATAINTLIVAS